MKIDHERSYVQSTMGSILSILMFVMVVIFSYQKMKVWITRRGVDIASATNDSYFDDEYIFSFEDGLNFAIAFTAYDEVTEPILDPTYGKIVFNSYQWGYGPELIAERIEIKTHPCTREELGLDDDLDSSNAMFYPIRVNNKEIVDKYWRKFVCIDKKDMFIHGSYNSRKARLMNM